MQVSKTLKVKVKVVIFLCFLLVFLSIFYFKFLKGKKILASSLDNVFGYAWSENIGWISFNQTDLTGCPTPPCIAVMSTTTGKLSGWARAVRAFQTEGQTLGGWSGWIHLAGTSTDGTPYGVYLNLTSRELEGWAWGEDVIGWISFNCKNQGVCNTSNYFVKTSFDLAPFVTNLSYTRDCCGLPPYYQFSWQFQDPDPGDSQSAYQLQVAKDSNFTDLQVDTNKVTSSAESLQVILAKKPSFGQLGYNTTYFWRVKVWDTYGPKSSAWQQASTSFMTPLHIFPSPNFYWIPQTITRNEVIQFCAVEDATCTQTSLSVCYNNNNDQISCQGKTFFWQMSSDAIFVDGTGPNTPNPRVKFSNIGSKNISLSITDDVGTCTTTKSIKTYLPLPKWKEISP